MLFKIEILLFTVHGQDASLSHIDYFFSKENLKRLNEFSVLTILLQDHESDPQVWLALRVYIADASERCFAREEALTFYQRLHPVMTSNVQKRFG